MNIAVIPARGGSKRIPKKNIKEFAGKPIINYSIEAALRAGVFDQVIVSTDDDAIAEAAIKAGASVPFKRPAELSGDFTVTADVLVHSLEWARFQKMNVEYLCCIYATAPFVRTRDIKEGLDKIRANKAGSVFSVTTFPYPIFRSLKINESGHIEMFWPEHELTRSNDLPEAYHDAGQFYWLDAKVFSESRKLFMKDSLPVILPRYLTQDIDTPEDWETAERIFEACLARGEFGA